MKPYVVLVIVLAVAIWVMMDMLSDQPVKHHPARVSNTHEAPRDGVGGTLIAVGNTKEPTLSVSSVYREF